MRSLSGMQKIIVSTLFAVLVIGFATDRLRNTFSDSDDKPLFSDERNRYITLHFQPKYKISDCAISFDLGFNKGDEQFMDFIEDAFQRYVSYHEPKVGFMFLQHLRSPKLSSTPKIKSIIQYELILSDQCDRKDQIFLDMVTYTLKQHGDSFSIRRHTEKKSELKLSRYWIDSPDYNPDYWATLHKAVRGDGEALYKMTEFQEENDHGGRHLYMSLAEIFLPDGLLKEKAKFGKLEAFKKMFPDQQKQADKAIEYWVQNIQKYKSE